MKEESATNTLELATELTIAWLANPNTKAPAEDVPAFLRKVHEAVASLSSGPVEDQLGSVEMFMPAVTVRKSLASKDRIISMIDGKPYKSLKRHLTRHGLTPDQYRQRYNLKPDYPMVSENYSQVRPEMAKKIGLGRKPASMASVAKSGPRAARRPRERPPLGNRSMAGERGSEDPSI
jgi:predicted transcriptional regulator